MQNFGAKKLMFLNSFMKTSKLANGNVVWYCKSVM